MKKFLVHIRNRVITGFVFLIPLFAVLLLVKKLWTVLTGAGNYLVELAAHYLFTKQNDQVDAVMRRLSDEK